MVTARKEKLRLKKHFNAVILLQKWLKKCLDRFRLKRKLTELTALRKKQAEITRKKELSIHKNNNTIDQTESCKDPLIYTKNVLKNTNNKQPLSKYKGFESNQKKKY